MDNRLDLFNSIREYEMNMSKEDAFLMIAHNEARGDIIAACSGNVNILSAALANDIDEEGNEYLKLKSEDEIRKIENIRKTVLNVAINILRANKEYRNIFSDAIKKL